MHMAIWIRSFYERELVFLTAGRSPCVLVNRGTPEPVAMAARYAITVAPRPRLRIFAKSAVFYTHVRPLNLLNSLVAMVQLGLLLWRIPRGASQGLYAGKTIMHGHKITFSNKK